MTAPLAARPSETGPVRAARLMRAMGRGAGPVWAELTPDETHMITSHMKDLRADETLDEGELLDLFLRDSETLGEPAEASQSAGPVGQKLQAAAPETLAVIAGRESPQIAAYILTHLSPRQAAGVLRMLDQAQAIAILKRMVNYTPPPEPVSCVINDSLNGMLERLGAGEGAGHERVARIFDQFDTRREGALLTGLEAVDPRTGEKVRALMFGFDDLGAFDAAGIQTLLANAERADLVLALKGARGSTREAFFSNMTQRAGELVREEMAALGAVRRSEVDAAQRLLVDIARGLIRRGDIRLDSTEDDELVE